MLLEIMLGDGKERHIEVAYFCDFLRNMNGCCALCNSDSDNWDDPTTVIGEFFENNKWAETCPVCQGRPT